jgi:SNF2 family DNA or RNA helicase
MVVNDENRKLRRTSRQLKDSNRFAVTPSPKVSDDKDYAADVVSESIDRKPVAKRKQSREVGKDSDAAVNVIIEEVNDVNTSSVQVKRTKYQRSKLENKASALLPETKLQEDSHSTSSEDEEILEGDEDDRPFKVEYATSSRSTCRRCDAIILKGSLRVSHVPLFRGKPGYTVYRHLECAIFSQEIVRAEDVGGWKKLRPTDFESLARRVEESKDEILRENEDLDPDELVQTGFKGETRNSPPGFVGSLLPFQVEGQSWMYNQEVHTPAIRGGILADEMGMVRSCFGRSSISLIISYLVHFAINTGQDHSNYCSSTR